ncbi:hypothetical protein [Mucilaginibacter glaciei]|uniref:Uncharacterized protein n=1 Tax=Mucilaginibacter glaciei TaxID=2772109 RepID=A0A926NI03_9SPHI|nr:hypothetical protein [Mucilaginibacter glaciei]MBD1392444.1 hypothetical protein [Mucilaginibacter glaciei]
MATKSVKMFETFEDLKSHEKDSVNYILSLERHNAFGEFIKAVKTQSKVQFTTAKLTK